MNMQDNSKFSVEGNSKQVPPYASSENKRPVLASSDEKSFKKIYEDSEEESEGAAIYGKVAADSKATALNADHPAKAAVKTNSGLQSPFDLSSGSAKKSAIEDTADTEVAMNNEQPLPPVRHEVVYNMPHTSRFNAQRDAQSDSQDNPSRQFDDQPVVTSHTQVSIEKKTTPAKSPNAVFMQERTALSDQPTGREVAVDKPIVANKEPLPSLLAMAAEASRTKLNPEAALHANANANINANANANINVNTLPNKAQADIHLDKDLPVEEVAYLSTSTQRKDAAAATTFTHEPMDLAAVNPGAVVAPTSIQTHTTVATERAQPVIRLNLQEIYNQLAKNLTEIRDTGKTETIITLGANTGVFQGARVVVTDFDAAKGHLNIVFENLDVRAQRLLDMPQHQAQLIQNLSKDGYFVQQFVTTTYNEPRLTVANTNLQGEQQQGNNQDEDQATGEQRRQRDQA
jgi:hypothetical protein